MALLYEVSLSFPPFYPIPWQYFRIISNTSETDVLSRLELRKFTKGLVYLRTNHTSNKERDVILNNKLNTILVMVILASNIW